MADETKGQIPPHGDALRRALRWLDEKRRDEPNASRVKLIDEAALRFDLSPNEVEFLLKNWGAP